MSSQKKKARGRSKQDHALVASLVAAAESAVASPTNAPVKVTELAATAIALTTKNHTLTAEQEEQLKTRLQYRLYQRNHRAKKQRHVQELEGEIAVLREEITTLEAAKELLGSRLATRTITEFLRAFRSTPHGAQDEQHEHNLRGIFDEHSSIDWIIHQWQSLSESFAAWEFEIANDHVCVVQAHEEDIAVISCLVVLKVSATEDQLAIEFPALPEDVLVALARRECIEFSGRVALIVRASTGLLVSMVLDLDIVTSIRLATECSLREVERIVRSSHCLLSLCGTAGKPNRINRRGALREEAETELREDGFAFAHIDADYSNDLNQRRRSPHGFLDGR